MSLLIGFLTFILVVNSLFLILLILIQLPKKEAGMGLAFGGGATDALFGAGSGTVLTKLTKYCAGAFIGLSLVLSIMNAHFIRASGLRVNQALDSKSAAAPSVPTVTPTVAPAVTPTPTTNLILSTTNVTVPAVPAPAATTPAAPVTNAPAPAPAPPSGQ